MIVPAPLILLRHRHRRRHQKPLIPIGRHIRFSRVFHARRETVFKAWSSTDHVKRWFSPETFTVSDAKVQMHIGGPFDVCMRSLAGEEHWTHGTFVEVAPHTRLVIDMHVTDSVGEPLFRAYTEVDFSDALGGTRMDVVQTYTFMDPSIAAPMVAGAPEGWRTTLDKLEKMVARMHGGTETGVRSVAHAPPLGALVPAFYDPDSRSPGL